MSRATRLLLALLLVSLLAPPAAAQATLYRVRPGDSTIQFTITKWSVFKEEGRFRDFDGTVLYDPKNPVASRVDFTVRLVSIDTKIGNRDQTLLSEDFFHAERYPTMSFRSARVTPGENGTLQVTGALTIRGITRTLTVPVKLLGFSHYMDGDERVDIGGFEATFTIDRRDFNVLGTQWSGGNLILSNEVTIHLLIGVESRTRTGRN
ncbi:MAG TPA: YceI family protein [Candidatus Xenobia bacterium]|nr:YceI family protein [Candidatus Xenobia bacterium]